MNPLSFSLRSASDGRQVFTCFLRSEFSEENIEFLNACKDFKQSPPEKMAAKAKLIFDQYVETDSPKQVTGFCSCNISECMRLNWSLVKIMTPMTPPWPCWTHVCRLPVGIQRRS